RLGGYEIMGVVGCGGMGVVLKAFEPPLNRYVAIKVLGPQLALSGAARQRFTREAKAAAAVVHDNVIAIHTIAEAGGLPYFVMPYLRGPSLERRLQRTGPLAVDEILRIGMQIARGLAAAHAQGLVHRDIKPANILLEEGVERVTITDFGLARAVDDASITRTGTIAGTPQYMSPEQAKGEFVDHRSDLFSLGSVLYALCSGRPPFRADSTLGVLRRVEEDDPRPIREINAQIPEWLAGLIERLHAKDPEDRLQSAEQVAGLLEGFLAHLRQPMTIAAPKLPPLRLSVQDEGTAKPTATEAARDLVSRYWKTLAKGRGIRLLLVALAPCLIACVLAVWLAESVRVLQGAPPIVESARAFYQDLRGSRQPAEPFVLAGPNAEAFVRPEPQGLRITLPAQRDKTDPVGIATSARIVGDFDITAGYEILSVQRPRTGAGVGFEFFVMTDTPTRNAIAFYRTARVREGDVYACGHNYQATTESKRIFDHTMTPTTCMSGHLRLIRTGSQITFLAAEGDSKDFRELRRCELGLDEIKMVRLAAYSGGVKAPVDIRLVDVNVQTTLPVAGLTATPSSGGSGAARGWLMAAGVIAVGVSLSFAGLWFFIRRNRGAEPPEQDSAAVEKPVEAEEKPVEAEVPSPSPFIMFPCSGCGKTLKVKAEWVGKKGKCSACGKESLVPGSPAEPAAVTVKAVRPARRMRTPAWITVPGLLLLAGIGAAFWYG
ncbi:MAG TPA: protein kinase, partial [Gemmataceae bacterium]|nr:protein kinase [Gemmataceae bacterium]